MSCYYSKYRDMLVLKCDGCGNSVDLYKGETDRTLKHYYIKEHGWKTYKDKRGKWIDICPNCKTAREDSKRAMWLREEVRHNG